LKLSLFSETPASPVAAHLTLRRRRRLRHMTSLTRDLRLAIRSLSKSPGFTVVVLLTLTLGLGANVAIFSVVNGVLLRPLDFRRPSELVSLSEINHKT